MQTDSLKPEACKLSERVLTELSAEERLNWSFVRISCMGYLNAFCVPHIDTKGTNEVARVDIAKKMLLDAQLECGMEHPIIGMGVDELAGIVYENGKLSIMSLGKRKNGIGEATCHILYVDQRREVMCIPLTPNTGEAATMEELIQRAMRSVEALQSPLDLIVSEEISISHAVHRRGVSGAIDWGLDLIDATVKTHEADAPLVSDQLLPPPPPPAHPHERTPSNLLYSPAINIERITSDMNVTTLEERCATPPLPPQTNHQHTLSNPQYSAPLHNIAKTSDDTPTINSVPVGELPPPPAPLVGLFRQGSMSALAAAAEQHNPNLPPLFPRGELPAIKVCNSHSI